MLTLKIKDLSEQEIDRVLEMAWEDLTPFEAIEAQFGLSETDIVKIMKLGMKQSGGQIAKRRAGNVSDKHPIGEMNSAPHRAVHKAEKR